MSHIRESVVWESDAVADAPGAILGDNSTPSGGLPKRCPHCDGEYDSGLTFCPRDGAVLRAIAPAEGDELTGQIIADRYRVLRKLGQGGMGQVYLAEHTRMGRFCAIKVMTPALLADTDAIARFDREASNASRITHPGVAAVYDFGEASDGIVYLAMEYVDGESLTALLQREQAIPIERALGIARQIAGGLGAAHELGIVHRDLKPENIMIGRNRDGSDCVKVVDFGISKGLHGVSQKLTITGIVVGTPAYMSPEQLAADPVDGRSDLYSLGLLLFHMVAGVLPFAGGHEGMLARLIAAPRSLAEMKPDREWPAGLQAVLDRALAPAPGDRYSTAEAMAFDIARLLDNPRTASLPTTVPVRGMAPVRRLPTVRMVVAGLAIVAATSAAAILGLPGRDDDGTETRPGIYPTDFDSADAITGRGALGAGGGVMDTQATTAEMPTGGSRTLDALPPGGIRDPGAAEVPAPSGARGTRPGPVARAAASSLAPPSTDTRLAPSAVAAELDSLEAWTSPATGTEATARRAIGRFETLLPRLSTSNDTVAAHYYAASAYLVLGDPASACATLRPIERRAAAHPFLANAIAIQLASTTLNCR